MTFSDFWCNCFFPCFRAVTVENCHNSTIVLGVTKTAVNIIGCDSCTFFAVCDRISFRFVCSYLFLSVTSLSVCCTLVNNSQSLSWVKWSPKPQGGACKPGKRSGESSRLPPMLPGFKSRRRHRDVGWVSCWFSPLLRVVFLWVLRFPLLLKNQHFLWSTSKCSVGKKNTVTT